MVLTSIDFRTPLNADNPCGPDLELEGDPAFINFMTLSEGLLPKAFFVRNPKEPDAESKPFNIKDDARGGFDLVPQLNTIAALSERTRDLRLLVLGAKLTILGRDLEQFIGFIKSIEALLETQWDDIHPKGEDGDFTLRFVAVQSLDDNAPVVFPLIYTPLFEDRRFGAVTYRTSLLANGEATARDEDEQKLDLASVRQLFDDEKRGVAVEVLMERRAQFQELNESLKHIHEIFVDKIGYEFAPTFKQLGEIARKIFAFLEETIAKRGPGLVLTETGDSATVSDPAVLQAQGGTGGPIVSFGDAAAALTAIADYCQRHEPSNPALLLVRQAKDLIGKPFLDVLRILVPLHAEEAVMKIGRTHVFDLRVERLSEFNSTSEFETMTETVFEVVTRDQMLHLLTQVSSFFQSVEPTSPIPLLLDRARAMAARDFISLLKEILPEDVLKSLI